MSRGDQYCDPEGDMVYSVFNYRNGRIGAVAPTATLSDAKHFLFMQLKRNYCIYSTE